MQGGVSGLTRSVMLPTPLWVGANLNSGLDWTKNWTVDETGSGCGIVFRWARHALLCRVWLICLPYG